MKMLIVPARLWSLIATEASFARLALFELALPGIAYHQEIYLRFQVVFASCFYCSNQETRYPLVKYLSCFLFHLV